MYQTVMEMQLTIHGEEYTDYEYLQTIRIIVPSLAPL